MMGHYYGHLGWFGFSFGWIFMIVFWGIIIWAIFALVRSTSGGGCYGSGQGKEGDDAIEILRQRYAKGELTKEDFDRMKKDLE